MRGFLSRNSKNIFGKTDPFYILYELIIDLGSVVNEQLYCVLIMSWFVSVLKNNKNKTVP